MANTLKFGNGQWATKEGSTLAYNSENGNFKPLPFDFTRASSATRVNKDGLIEVVTNNKPRIDFLNDSNGALLLEPTRSNLIVNSQALSLSPIKNGTFTDDFAISPDGTQNATKLTAPSSDPFFYQSVSFAAASYIASIYVKGIGSSIGKDFRIVLGGLSSYPKLIIPSEWTRFEYTATMSSGSANAGIEIPDPAISGDEVLIWGWQVEQGSYATSYIPTQGSAVTRVAEVCSQTPPSGIIGQTEGVMFVDFNFTGGYDTSGIIPIVIRSGTNSAYIFINVSGTLNCDFFDGNVLQARLTTNIGISGRKKIAFAYKQNDFVAYMNGVQIGTDTNGTVGAMGILNVGSYYTGGYSTIGGVNQSQLYNTRLSNTELATLTTI
jgi:hypothetical protein